MVQAWYSQFNDPHKSEWDDDGTRREINDGEPGMGFRLGVDLSGAEDWTMSTIKWYGPFFWYNDYARVNAVFEATGEAVTLFIESQADNAFQHCDAYVDAAELRRMDTPDPEPVDYAVVVELLPQDATLAEKQEVLARTHADRRTILQSADDAARLVAPGLPGSKVDVWEADSWPGDIEAYLRARGVKLIEFFWLTPTPPDPPDPPTPVKPVVPTGIIAGWGTIGDQGQSDIFRNLAAQGAAPPSAKFVQDLGAATIVKQYAPATVIIGRKIDVEYNGRTYNVEGFDYSANADPVAQADARMELLREMMQANPAVTHWEITNEIQPPRPEDITRICEFFKRAMVIAEGWGKRLALFSFSTGTPSSLAWDYALATGVFEEAIKRRAVISLHEYGLWPRDANSHLLRFKALYDLLVPLDLVVPLYITEYGVPREAWDTTDKMAQLRAYDEQLARFPYVGGAHTFVNVWDPPYGEYVRIYPEYQAYAESIKGRVNG